MKGLILAGGLGTRLRPLSYTGPKQLVPVANKPVLFYCIEDLKNAGVQDIGIIVGYTPKRINMIKDAVGDGSRWGVNITYIEQDAPRGLAHAVGIAQEFMTNNDFVVYLGDNMLKGGIKYFVDHYKNSEADCSILLTKVDNPQRYGVAILGENSEVIEVEEKPKQPRSNLAIVGVYIFNSKIFNHISTLTPGKGGELQLTDAIAKMVASSSEKVSSHIVQGWWDDTGTAEAMLRANHLVLLDIETSIKGEVSAGAKLIGSISIGENTIIESGCVLKGPLIIGKNCTIKNNAYVGPYTSIGDSCVIDGGEIEGSIILDNVHIKLSDKMVESLIGKHAKILSENRVPKGRRFIIGENSEVIL